MAINFNTLGDNLSQPTEVQPVQQGISLNLNKGTFLDLSKSAPGLTNVDLCAGWDVAQQGQAVDLDIVAFLLNANNKLTSGNDVVFFNNMNQAGVTLQGDNLTGAGDGDDEIINVRLPEVSPNVNKIVFSVVIYDANNRRQTFGMVNNSYVRLVNKDNNTELAKFQLKDDYSTDTAVVFAELVRDGNKWVFHAIGDGKNADLNTLAGLFM